MKYMIRLANTQGVRVNESVAVFGAEGVGMKIPLRSRHEGSSYRLAPHHLFGSIELMNDIVRERFGISKEHESLIEVMGGTELVNHIQVACIADVL